MKKKLLVFGTVATVTLTSALFPNSSVLAQPTLQDIDTERQEIKSQLSKAEADIADVLYEIKEINEELTRVQSALDENQAQLENTEAEIEKYEEEVAKLQEEIDLLNEEIEKRNDILKSRISSYQDNGGNAQFLEVFLGATDFTDFISRISAVTTITKADADLIEQQEKDMQKVEEKQAEVEVKLSEQEELLVELEGINAVILEQKEEVENSKKKLQKKQTEFEEKKSKLESRDSNLAALEAEILASIEAQSTTSSNNNSNSNGSSNSGGTSNESGSSSNTQSTTQAVPYTGGGGSAIAAGKQFIGRSTYVFGAQNPGAGQFDCSGFVSWAYAQEGVSLPRSTSGMVGVGSKVSYSDAQPGDLVFFDTYKTNGHVGIYLGGGKFLGSQSSTGVAIADMNSGYWKDTFKGHVRRVK